jgi:UDP-N-acetylglucosamine transferase subunit ALG13
MAMAALNILFAVHDWGLGHATRDLTLIRGLLDAGHSVTLLSNGRALRLLQDELGDACETIALRDIPKPLSRHSPVFYVKMSLSLPMVFRTFHHEHRITERLCRERCFDRVISDSRYGVWSGEVPSFYLVHSLRQIIPGRPRALEKLVEASQRSLLSHARRLLIPDQAENGLAGDLCHDLACDWGDRIEYIGVLASMRQCAVDEDVDVFVSISGAEPQRSIFEEMVLSQVRDVPGRIVVALGRPEAETTLREDGRISIYPYLNRRQAEEMMNRARLVVTRSGYTTLMELAELGKHALLVPTVGQSEQEYLGDRLERRGEMHTVRQRDLSLKRDVEAARGYRGLPRMHPTEESVRRFLAAVYA